MDLVLVFCLTTSLVLVLGLTKGLVEPFLGSYGLQETHMDALKYFQFQIGNIDSGGRFLYKIRHSGPRCSAAYRAPRKRRRHLAMPMFAFQ